MKMKAALRKNMRVKIWQFSGAYAPPCFEKGDRFVPEHEGLLRVWEKLSCTYRFAL
jgi:hypothetical protein